MSRSQQALCVFYALVSIAALFATWSQNLSYGAPNPLDTFGAFIEGAKVNPASRSITVDIGFFLLAAAAFMVSEARRLGVRFVWLYVLFGFLVAISVTFPLFMIAREMRLAKGPDAAAPLRLTVTDILGLTVTAGLVLALCFHVLS
ncbi:MAG TPA: DUF2834 domain-containing protein [Caulobacterales bacterium]|nr:DUF2834 domain-containing protein [Caulobacterales bacterium]